MTKQTMHDHPTMTGVKVSSKELNRIWKKEKQGKEIAIQVTDSYSEMNSRAKYNSIAPGEHKEIMTAAITEAKKILDHLLSEEFKNG